MFLIRTAFWLSIVVMFIPADPESNSPAPRVSLIEGMIAARAVVTDLSSFCERNPNVCVTGGAALQVFADKAQNGAKMLYRYLDDGLAPAEGQGTLTGEDLSLEWQGPAA
jgi:hypothetical protein